MNEQPKSRRAMLAGIGAAAVAGVSSAIEAEAQATAATPFTPALFDSDAWMSSMPGRQRVVLDVETPERMPDAIRFVGNIFTAHKNAYGLEDRETALIVCFRHSATPMGYTDAIWSKYGKVIDAKNAPTANPYNSGDRMQLSDLAKRGVQFMVCGTASRGLATRIAGPGGDVDAVMKEMQANLLPSARLMAAGIVGVIHAQNRGFALIHVG